MSTVTPTAGQAILAVIESDLLVAGGTPLLTFLQQFGAAAGDPIKIVAAWAELRGGLLGSLPGLEATLSGQIAMALETKLQAAIAKAQGK